MAHQGSDTWSRAAARMAFLAAVALPVALAGGVAWAQGGPAQGTPSQGTPSQGMPSQGGPGQGPGRMGMPGGGGQPGGAQAAGPQSGGQQDAQAGGEQWGPGGRFGWGGGGWGQGGWGQGGWGGYHPHHPMMWQHHGMGPQWGQQGGWGGGPGGMMGQGMMGPGMMGPGMMGQGMMGQGMMARGWGMRSAMRMIDTNGDGAISADEAAAWAEAMFDRFDLDDDDRIPRDAFLMLPERPMLPSQVESLRRRREAHFKAMDRNNDGFVDHDEWIAFHRERFQAADLDKDGKVSPWEFRAAMRRR